MRRVAAPCFAVVLVLALLPAVSAGYSRQLGATTRCHGPTVTRSGDVRIVRRPERYFACVGTRGRGWKLDARCFIGVFAFPDLSYAGPGYSGCSQMAAPVVRGRRAAYGLETEWSDYTDVGRLSQVAIVDLAGGRKWWAWACGVDTARFDDPSLSGGMLRLQGQGPVASLILADDSTVVYTAKDRIEPSRGNAVCRSQIGAPTRILARGPGIDLRSLSLAGDVVRWKQDGAPREIPLRAEGLAP